MNTISISKRAAFIGAACMAVVSIFQHWDAWHGGSEMNAMAFGESAVMIIFGALVGIVAVTFLKLDR